MPPDGIAVTVSLIGPPLAKARLRAPYKPIRGEPLRLPAHTISALEGSPDVPEYREFRRAPDYLVEVRVAINNPRPPRPLIAEARSAVQRIRLPNWRKLC